MIPCVRWLMLPSSRNTGRWYALLACSSVATCVWDVGVDVREGVSEGIADNEDDGVLSAFIETVPLPKMVWAGMPVG
jgi:hypothetical protein